jgi:hypothetical protein
MNALVELIATFYLAVSPRSLRLCGEPEGPARLGVERYKNMIVA